MRHSGSEIILATGCLLFWRKVIGKSRIKREVNQWKKKGLGDGKGSIYADLQ
jgi:hypothetical protein